MPILALVACQMTAGEWSEKLEYKAELKTTKVEKGQREA